MNNRNNNRLGIVKTLFNITLLLLLLGSFAELYAQEKVSYSKTVLDLEQKLSAEPLSALEFYNLGTAYAKLDSLSEARLYLEKAQLLAPWNAAIEQNIKWVKTELATDVAIIPEFFLSRIWKKLALTAAPLFWQVSGILLLALTLILSFYILFKNRKKNRRLIGSTLVAMGLLAIISFALSATASGHLYDENRCVVIEVADGLKETPEKSSASLAHLVGGTIAEVQEELGDWVSVKLEDGSIGWIEKIYLKNISFNPTKSGI